MLHLLLIFLSDGIHLLLERQKELSTRITPEWSKNQVIYKYQK